jgi:predicted Zn finger-like uncharacterized protein
LSLVTRCPACGTVFRVVQDQLKVSEGWVRCGRCSEVFNAVDGLFDLERESAAPAAADAGSAASLDPAEGMSPEKLPLAEPQATSLPDPAPELPPHLPTAEAAPLPYDPAAYALALAHAGAGLAPPSDEAMTALAAEAAADEPVFTDEPAAMPEMVADYDTDALHTSTPDFVRRAERAARLRHPALRVTLWLLAPLLAAALAAQLALHYRDGLAANWPAARPWLEQACGAVGCHIEAPRRIDSLTVDSSGLVRIEGSRLYKLSLVLQNRAVTAVRMPSIDLALTDNRGQTMIRRVL